VTFNAGGGDDFLLRANNVRAIGDLGAGDDQLWIDPAVFARASMHVGAANDVAFGGSLADQIWGDAGDDLLVDGAGNDELRGDVGDDLLVGGAGMDRLDGGAGADLFLGVDVDDMLLGTDRRDTIVRRPASAQFTALDTIFRVLARRAVS